MSILPPSIPKNPEMKPAEDFYHLRRKGIEFIEQMGSAKWTDYNIHDPGITILEALCYAINDLAYRTGWDINDLLALDTLSTEPSGTYQNQAFFPPWEILTVNPVTPDDFRRILINLERVRNAWIFCTDSSCDPGYYAWCEEGKLKLSYHPSDFENNPQPVVLNGIYDALLELENDPELGDLNDHKIEQTLTFKDQNGSHPIVMELRFPEKNLPAGGIWSALIANKAESGMASGIKLAIKSVRLGAARDFDLFTAPGLDSEEKRDEYLRKHWNALFYLDLEVVLTDPAAGTSETVTFKQITMRLYSDAAARRGTTAKDLRELFVDIPAPGKPRLGRQYSGSGMVMLCRDKLKKAGEAVASAKSELQACRNLSEDYRNIRVAGIEEVAVCADVDVRPDADIELVQAKIWLEIEQYFNPPVPFYSLQELIDSGLLMEEIFNGPALENGFIKSEDLQAAQQKQVLRASDIINRLMKIDGVIAIHQLQMVKYDSEGSLVKGTVDPDLQGASPVFNPEKNAASWLMYISRQHQPRLYRNASRFLFFKDGLPFKPRMDEASATLTQLRGESERPKFRTDFKKLPLPTGKYRNPGDYFPVQYSFPLTYGIGPAGVPAGASPKRKAQAQQLKEYLMVFEQLLGNAYAQLANLRNLFSLDPALKQTYFVKEFSSAIIDGYDQITKAGLDASAIHEMVETVPEFLKRRNRFLDHLLARFGEQFGEYALLLTSLKGEQTAQDLLIGDKISFLKEYPQISRDRAKGFNYRKALSVDNVPGIKKRVSLLLGSSDMDLIVVEHLLLRPKFPGDALYPACTDGACAVCGDEDPYSFRMTFVMPGWMEPFDTNLEMRDFADRTIRQETPAHLLGKICWIARDEYVRFEEAWSEWLNANSSIDWMEERLSEQVAAILSDKLIPSAESDKLRNGGLCRCADMILLDCGTAFHEFMGECLMSGRSVEEIPEFIPPDVKLCADFVAGTANLVRELLHERYNRYRDVSYRLWTVVSMLGKLNNVYPAATLHDWDEGNDENPVRLGKTALGS